MEQLQQQQWQVEQLALTGNVTPKLSPSPGSPVGSAPRTPVEQMAALAESLQIADPVVAQSFQQWMGSVHSTQLLAAQQQQQSINAHTAMAGEDEASDDLELLDDNHMRQQLALTCQPQVQAQGGAEKAEADGGAFAPFRQQRKQRTDPYQATAEQQQQQQEAAGSGGQ